MSIAPAAFRSKSIPFLSLACLVLVGYFVIKAAFFGGAIGLYSLILGAAAALVGLWALWRSRQTSVLIDAQQLVINRGTRSEVYDRSEIIGIDLSAVEQQITFKDGTGIRLPLEGLELVEVGLLLSPVLRRTPDSDAM